MRRVFDHMKSGEESGRKQYAEHGAGRKPLPGNLLNCQSCTRCSSSVFLSDASFLFFLRADSDVLVSKHMSSADCSLVRFFHDAQCVTTKI